MSLIRYNITPSLSSSAKSFLKRKVIFNYYEGRILLLHYTRDKWGNFSFSFAIPLERKEFWTQTKKQNPSFHMRDLLLIKISSVTVSWSGNINIFNWCISQLFYGPITWENYCIRDMSHGPSCSQNFTINVMKSSNIYFLAGRKRYCTSC